MTYAVILNAILGFIMVLTLCFTMGDATSILETDTLFPFIQIFYNTTQSYAATNVMVTILIVTLTSSAISEVATASRQLWSFARDGGVPFAAFLQRVSQTYGILRKWKLTELQGHTGLEYPPQRRPCVSRCHDPTLTHQHRIHGRAKRHNLAHYRLPRLFVYDYHLMHPDETNPQGTTPGATMDIGSLRLRSQCLCFDVPGADLRFLVFPSNDPRCGKHYELGYCLIQ